MNSVSEDTKNKKNYNMTDKKCDFANKQQNWTFPSIQLAHKNGLRQLSNLETVVDAVSNHPKDVTISRNQ